VTEIIGLDEEDTLNNDDALETPDSVIVRAALIDDDGQADDETLSLLLSVCLMEAVE